MISQFCQIHDFLSGRLSGTLVFDNLHARAGVASLKTSAKSKHYLSDFYADHPNMNGMWVFAKNLTFWQI